MLNYDSFKKITQVVHIYKVLGLRKIWKILKKFEKFYFNIKYLCFKIFVNIYLPKKVLWNVFTHVLLFFMGFIFWAT